MSQQKIIADALNELKNLWKDEKGGKYEHVITIDGMSTHFRTNRSCICFELPDVPFKLLELMNVTAFSESHLDLGLLNLHNSCLNTTSANIKSVRVNDFRKDHIRSSLVVHNLEKSNITIDRSKVPDYFSVETM